MRLDFYLPVPLNPGCNLEITFPKQYSVQTVQYLQTQNVFGRIQTFKTSFNNLDVYSLSNKLRLLNVCESYRDNNMEGTILIYSLRQPDYVLETDSFMVEITSVDGDRIAKVDEGVTFTPTKGILDATTDASIKTVQEETDVIFEILPEHEISLANEAVIEVEFPGELRVTVDQCIVKDVSVDGSVGFISPECYRNQQTLTVGKFLA